MGFFNRNKENKPKYDRVKGIGKAGALAGGLAGAATGLYNGKGLGKSLLYGLGGAAAGGIAGSVAGKIHNNAEKRDFEDRVKSGDTNPGGDYEERKRRRKERSGTEWNVEVFSWLVGLLPELLDYMLLVEKIKRR